MRAVAKIVLLAALVLSCTGCTSEQEKVWKELTTKSKMLYQQGRYSEAIQAAKETLQVAENTFGPNHPYTTTSLNNLALVYKNQGKYAEAEPLYNRSLKIREEALGPNHPDVAAVCENLAELCRQIGKEDEAKKLEARATRIRSNR